MRSLLCVILFLGLIFSDDVVLENKAPTFYSNTLEGKKFYLSDHLGKDRSIFLSFFATWCLPCRVEMPILDSLQHVYTNTDFYLINVSGLQQGDRKLKEKTKDVKKLIDMLGVTIPVLMDKYGQVAEKYDALALPRSVIIDSDGNIVYAHTGYASGDEKEFIKILDDLHKNED